MRKAGSPTHLPADRPRRLGPWAVAAVVLAAVVAMLAGPGSAVAATKSEKLADVREAQERLAEQIESHNGEVNALIGQVSEVREREAAVNAELIEREAELARLGSELHDGRKRLTKLRKELSAAQVELDQLLVSLYKSGSSGTGAILVDSADFQDVAVQNEYFDRLQSYQSSVIERTEALREETGTLVTELAEKRARAARARDVILLRRDEVAAARAELEQQEAALREARRGRREALDSLTAREEQLLESMAPAEPAGPASPASVTSSEPAPAPVPGETAQLGSDGQAIPPASAPPAVVAAIQAANSIATTPYLWGGGHGSFDSSGYDCSGAVSFALHGAGLISSPSDSTGLMFWGEAGAGQWITVYAHSGHAYVVIAGLRFDTSGGAGPRWHADARSSAGFTARHPGGL